MASIISGVVTASPVCECDLYRLCGESRGGLSMNQSIDQSNNQSINQSIKHLFPTTVYRNIFTINVGNASVGREGR